MKRFRSASFALASVVLAVNASRGARPHYGGTLRIETEATIRALDPTRPPDPDDALTTKRLLPLVFETLVAPDASGGLRPVLASSWATDARGLRWRFPLRPGIRRHDGATLESWQVAAALAANQSGWTVRADGNDIVIDLQREQPNLAWELADARHAVAVRRSAGDLVGTGPFRIERVEINHASLRAFDDYWAGRVFLDGVQVEGGRALPTELADLENGRADMITVQPTDTRRLAQRGLHVGSSLPLELFALAFQAHRATESGEIVRRTLAMAVDRTTMSRVLLQGQAVPAEGLLPRWLTGYTPLFSLGREGGLSRSAVAALPPRERELTLRTDTADPLALAISERIAVDARERGFSINVQAPGGLAPRPDIRLIRAGIGATSPDRALAGLMTVLARRGIPAANIEAPPAPGAPIDAVYRVERVLLVHFIIVPIVHVPEIYGLGERVDSWNGPVVLPSGEWDLANVWLKADER